MDGSEWQGWTPKFLKPNPIRLVAAWLRVEIKSSLTRTCYALFVKICSKICSGSVDLLGSFFFHIFLFCRFRELTASGACTKKTLGGFDLLSALVSKRFEDYFGTTFQQRTQALMINSGETAWLLLFAAHVKKIEKGHELGGDLGKSWGEHCETDRFAGPGVFLPMFLGALWLLSRWWGLSAAGGGPRSTTGWTSYEQCSVFVYFCSRGAHYGFAALPRHPNCRSDTTSSIENSDVTDMSWTCDLWGLRDNGITSGGRALFAALQRTNRFCFKIWKDDESIWEFALKYQVSTLLRFAGCDECQQALLLSAFPKFWQNLYIDFFAISTNSQIALSHSRRVRVIPNIPAFLLDCLGWWRCRALTWREIRLESISVDNRVWGRWVHIKSYPLISCAKKKFSYDFLRFLEAHGVLWGVQLAYVDILWSVAR